MGLINFLHLFDLIILLLLTAGIPHVENAAAAEQFVEATPSLTNSPGQHLRQATITPDQSFGVDDQRIERGHTSFHQQGIAAPGLSDVDNGGERELFSDSSGAIGLDHYVEAVNHVVAAYDRKLHELARMDLSEFTKTQRTLWRPLSPQVAWDPSSQRWLYSAFGEPASRSVPGFVLMYGWSKGQDPTIPDLSDAFCHFLQVIGDGQELGNFELRQLKLGFDAGHVIVSGDVVHRPAWPDYTTPGDGIGGGVIVIDKPSNSSTNPCSTPRVTQFIPGRDHWPGLLDRHMRQVSSSPVAVRNMYPGGVDGLLIGADAPSHLDGEVNPSHTLTVWRIAYRPDGLPEIFRGHSVLVPEFVDPPAVSQRYVYSEVPWAPNSDHLDVGTARLHQAIAIKDQTLGGRVAVFTAHTVGEPGLPVHPASVRWYEIGVDGVTPVRLYSGSIGASFEASRFPPWLITRQDDVLDIHELDKLLTYQSPNSPSARPPWPPWPWRNPYLAEVNSEAMFNPAISPTINGDVFMITYNQAGVFAPPQLRIGWHNPGSSRSDALSRSSSASTIQVIAGSIHPMISLTPAGRTPWGGYASASPDPLDSSAVWATNMLSGTRGYRDRSGRPAGESETSPYWTTMNLGVPLAGPPPNSHPRADAVVTPSSPPNPPSSQRRSGRLSGESATPPYQIGTDDRDSVIDRALLKKWISDPTGLFTQIRVVPHFEDNAHNAPIGFRLFAIKVGSPFDRAGLRNGDIVRRVNGVDLVSSTEVLKNLVENLPRENHVRLEIIRNRNPVGLEYSIEDSPSSNRPTPPR